MNKSYRRKGLPYTNAQYQLLAAFLKKEKQLLLPITAKSLFIKNNQLEFLNEEYKEVYYNHYCTTLIKLYNKIEELKNTC